MLIISKFHDYYDVGMKNGVDKTVVYDRNTIAVQDKFLSVNKSNSIEWATSVIAFCGRFYPLVYHVTDKKIDRIIWDVEEAVRDLPRSKWKYSWDKDRVDTEPGIRKFFDRKYPELEHLFHKYRTPIFGFAPARSYAWRKPELYETLVINPNLKDIEFYKVLDPITAFQDIYMFMSGVIGAPPKLTRSIDDKVMAASKGHDSPYSFRKPPGKRGKTRWR